MMKNIEPEKIIQNILLHELELPLTYGKDKDGFIIPSVYVYSPDVSCGYTDKLQICIQSISSKVLANSNTAKSINKNFTEIQEVILQDTVQLDIFSRNKEAKMRRFEVITALHSTYSQEIQDKNTISIFQIPSKMNSTSIIEGSARIYRYTLTFEVRYKHEYTKIIDYYDKFRFNYGVDDISNPSSFNLPDSQ